MELKKTTRSTGRIRLLVERLRRPLQAAVVSLLLLAPAAGIASAEPATTSKTHVYLLRGAFNIFSLGLDGIADKLRRLGIYATVDNYLGWQSLADQAVADYKSGRLRTIILVGHSSGAAAVTSMAGRLGQYGVPVKLAIGLDPTSRETASGHVDRYINYYIGNGMGTSVDKGRQFTGALQNVNVQKNPQLGHFNIDKDEALQNQVVREIRAAL